MRRVMSQFLENPVWVWTLIGVAIVLYPMLEILRPIIDRQLLVPLNFTGGGSESGQFGSVEVGGPAMVTVDVADLSVGAVVLAILAQLLLIAGLIWGLVCVLRIVRDIQRSRPFEDSVISALEGLTLAVILTPLAYVWCLHFCANLVVRDVELTDALSGVPVSLVTLCGVALTIVLLVVTEAFKQGRHSQRELDGVI